MKFLDGLTEPSYALMRFFAGLFFVQHGTQKLLNFPAEFPYELNAMSTAAGWIELVLGLAIAFGLFTRISAFLSSGMSAVGYWMVHGGFGVANDGDFFPINNGGELIALYCFTFLFIACRGAGSYSLDGLIFNKSSTA
ncbi:MAG: DoxX family protein [Pseudomonadota bacterium]